MYQLTLAHGTVGDLWWRLLSELLHGGDVVQPRGRLCREIVGVTLRLADARHNLFAHAHRKLSYRFAVAEWLWMWFGHEDVSTIERYNPNIAKFSDDGKVFAGAYGPRIKRRWAEVMTLLRTDHDTRQAVIVIFRPVGVSKDVPCTLTIQFVIRQGQLCTLVNMRSSDVWLGLPYDAFNFTMLANVAAADLGVDVGWFELHIGSSHLYEDNAASAAAVLEAPELMHVFESPKLPGVPPDWLDLVLTTGRTPGVELKTVWTRYANVLAARSNAEALNHLAI